MESQPLEHHKRPRSANSNDPLRRLTHDGFAAQRDLSIVFEGQMQAGRDDGRPIFRKREQPSRLSFSALLRLNQKIYRYRRVANTPALPRGFALFIFVGTEFGFSQALGHFLIPLFTHQREGQSQVQIHRADMGHHILRQIFLLDQ